MKDKKFDHLDHLDQDADGQAAEEQQYSPNRTKSYDPTRHSLKEGRSDESLEHDLHDYQEGNPDARENEKLYSTDEEQAQA